MTFLSIAFSIQAQVPQQASLTNDFSFYFYRDTSKGKVLEAICGGKSATRVNEQQVLVDDFEMKLFRDNSAQEPRLVAQAPKCLVNVDAKIASSDGSLKAFTPATNLFIQGTGFLCSQSNSLLVISNQVETLVSKSLVRSAADLAKGANKAAQSPVKITSQYFELHYDRNQILYSGNVLVSDGDTEIHCATLHADYGTNGALERVTAQNKVVITLPNHAIATGDQAVYVAPSEGPSSNGEAITLTGNAHWQQAEREATADVLAFDRAHNTATATGNAKLRFSNRNLKYSLATASAPNVEPAGFSDLFAETIKVETESSDSQIASLDARGKILITNELDHSFAAADQATYSRSADLFKLTGNAFWKRTDLEISGQTLSLQQSNKTFSVSDHATAILRLNDRVGGLFGSRKPVQSSLLRVVKIHSRDLNMVGNEATFTGGVEATLWDGSIQQGTMTCDQLTATFGTSNRLQEVKATGKVRAETIPVPPAAKKTLSCASLLAKCSPETGQVQSLHAVGDVLMAEFNRKPAQKRIATGELNLVFSPTTNQIESATAENGVVGQFTKTGSEEITEIAGQRADYSALRQSVEIRGNPEAKTDKFLLSGADVMIWDEQKQIFRGSGPYKIIPLGDVRGLLSHKHE